MACGAVSRQGHVCSLPLGQGHGAYHLGERGDGKSALWAVNPCEDVLPDELGWYCSLDKGHAGEHQGWRSHCLGRGEEPEYRWPSAGPAPYWPAAA